jgi:hypothetical protein
MLPPDNLVSAEAIRDPQGFFRRLREHDPVFWSNMRAGFSLRWQGSLAISWPALRASVR